ncbi:hypothetical protein [Agrobacterium rubi]|uniref:Uncharacterized protein n=1 Tax=Agrobacterium rubi TaxID=28099 RepID=A0AAE7R0Z7_9HYPH|nr:hypothetical protein [Agrobacterium rubi]NTE86893.1 hypothetical protein [Agrobacterium rubi]NTF02827.1 hypothetical protein [Agrobacterium rubi]NTF08028.1 hypothetical protein [Agrobacterium rubi]NTF20256.1 hypothetical protein [Agrobacterium rubi]NTF27227.1 hypothetical protein [Agrobacterium rubi]
MIVDAIQDFDGGFHVQQSALQIATVITADERPVMAWPAHIRQVEKDGKLEFQLVQAGGSSGGPGGSTGAPGGSGGAPGGSTGG